MFVPLLYVLGGDSDDRWVPVTRPTDHLDPWPGHLGGTRQVVGIGSSGGSGRGSKDSAEDPCRDGAGVGSAQ